MTSTASEPDHRQPVIDRRPEIIHGIRNLVQNAVDFARANVWIDVFWDDASIVVRIVDDGKGYPSNVINRIGDPFMRRRRRDPRPGYEGMGLGLVHRENSLERTGAELSFANGRDIGEADDGPGERQGAIVEARWLREIFAEADDAARAALGKNQPIER